MKLKKKYNKVTDNNVDELLAHLEQMEVQFAFYVTETENLDKEALAIQESGEDVTPAGTKRLQELYDKVEELFVRYQKDVKIHTVLQERVVKYFKDKYNIDLGL